MTGTVVRSTGSWYDVMTDEGQRLTCKVKGNFRLRGIRSTNPVAVGDRVVVTEDATQTPYIKEVLDRSNYIVRKASNLSKQSHILAANIDQALLIATIARPETSTTFIDRFLACAEAYRVPVVIAFNKTDTLSAEERELKDGLAALYADIGYKCLSISALKATGLEDLRGILHGKTTLMAGNSGVGKSTLLNTLIPGANARTAEISDAHQTGMHTTTYSEMFPLPDGGGLIDIPGIKGFGTFDIEPEEVAHYFRDIFHISAKCRFNNCTHTHEPGCAVLEALENHQLPLSRYQSYLSMMEDKDDGKYRAAF